MSWYLFKKHPSLHFFSFRDSLTLRFLGSLGDRLILKANPFFFRPLKVTSCKPKDRPCRLPYSPLRSIHLNLTLSKTSWFCLIDLFGFSLTITALFSLLARRAPITELHFLPRFFILMSVSAFLQNLINFSLPKRVYFAVVDFELLPAKLMNEQMIMS